jgi:DNA-nicking Smr family endonuclease
VSRRKRPGVRPLDPFDPLDGPVDATLDLHGATSIDVRSRLAGFLETAIRRTPGGLVHVVTGRGRGSPGRPVVRPAVARLLTGELASYVGAFSRDENDGGFMVRLAGR